MMNIKELEGFELAQSPTNEQVVRDKRGNAVHMRIMNLGNGEQKDNRAYNRPKAIEWSDRKRF
jgi:hypothetical protein